MKIKLLLLTLLVSLSFSTLSWAVPPSEIDLSYDVATKTLHIKIIHVTRNVHKHHIRRLEISKNGELISDLKLVSQTTNSKIDQDVTIEAKSGDILTVKATCNQAGIKEESLTVAEPKKETANASDEESSASSQPAQEMPAQQSSGY